MNGSMANGSRRTTPTAPVAAAVVSEESVAPMNTPWFQSRASVTSGIVVLRRPPKRIAEIGTPFGSVYSGARVGHWVIGVQNREFGCDEGSSESGVQSCFFQLVRCAGGSSVRPSHQRAAGGGTGARRRGVGCGEGPSESGVQSCFFQLVRCAGGSSVMPSHQTSPSSVSATLVKTELPLSIVRIALGLVSQPVPGATPNRPYSGLTA